MPPPRPLLPILALFVVIAATLTSAPALALNPERHYEMVSPPYKGGLGATVIEAVAENGEGVAYYSPGVFAGAPVGLTASVNSLDYFSRRGPAGWSTVPLAPPTGLMPYVNSADISPSFGETLAMGIPGPNYEAALDEGTEEEFLLRSPETGDVSADWQLAGMALKTLADEPVSLRYEGASTNFCHLYFEENSVQPLLEGALDAKAFTLYELARGCDGEPVALRLVALDGNGDLLSPLCKVDKGVEVYDSGAADQFHAISADGSGVFFTTCIKNQTADHQLFVRLGGSRTVEVSRPLSEACGEDEVPCKGAAKRAPADFAGASEDGSKVFFTTTAPLVPGDTDTSNNLYLATIGCPAGHEGCGASERVVTSLTRTSAPVDPSEPADLQGVVKLAPDGSRVYFVAQGVLTGEPGPGGRTAIAGADNLYVYEPDPEHEGQFKTAFIGDLCSGYELSGSVGDLACPNRTTADQALWTVRRGVQTAGADGRFLVFSSDAQLTPDDTDAAADVYRYDAVTGALVRVSGGEGGYDSDGNSSAFDATIPTAREYGQREEYELNSRAVSEDGSRIVFTSAEPLSASAKNHLTNAYEWHEVPGTSSGGSVSLLSGGAGESPVEDVVMSPSGNDVFFVTTQGLLPQDTDGAPDVYDARIGSGFPSAPAQPRACAGDACQGPLTNPAALLVPGSVSQAPGENLPAPVNAQAKARPKAKSKPKACKKGLIRKKSKCIRKPKKRPSPATKRKGH